MKKYNWAWCLLYTRSNDIGTLYYNVTRLLYYTPLYYKVTRLLYYTPLYYKVTRLLYYTPL